MILFVVIFHLLTKFFDVFFIYAWKYYLYIFLLFDKKVVISLLMIFKLSYKRLILQK